MPIQNWGTGREDYSQNVEVSTVAIVRSHQFRRASSIEYSYYSFTSEYVVVGILWYPEVYTELVYVQRVTMESDTSNLVRVGIAQYASLAALLAGYPPIAILGQNFGFGNTFVQWTKGIIYNPDEPYAWATIFMVTMDNPYPTLPKGWPPDIFNAVVSVHSFTETLSGEV